MASSGGSTGLGGIPGSGGVLGAGGVPGDGGSPSAGGATNTGGSGGASSGGSSGSAGTGGGASSGGGTGGSGPALTAMCTVDDLLPPAPAGTGLGKSCSSFVTPTSDGKGILTEFGPYGAAVEGNTGKAFAVAPTISDTPTGCAAIASTFGEDPKLTNDVLNLHGADLSLYTVFRPANWVEGETYPIITWGNGTCAYPGSYSAVLGHVASHGFVVVASNGRFVSNGAQKNALDFMFAANDDQTSPYYHRLDTAKVGAMGHSQGSAATATVAASDARIKYVILFNGGASAAKPFLAISGDRDIGAPTVASYAAGTNGAPMGAYIFYHKILQTTGTITGHLVLMMQPDRVVDATTGWWQYMLKGDTKARDLFVGSSCGLCGKSADFDYGEKGLN
jgi:hypothetical protein